MRIVAGKLRGKKFDAPRNFQSRPTTDFAREALFNILQNRIDFSSVTVLDLFSGTGAFSYEAFSRGAEEIVAVDFNFSSVNFITKKMYEFEMSRAKIIKADVLDFITGNSGKFDLILADPPFDFPDLNRIPELVLASGILLPGGWLVLEHPPKKDFSGMDGFAETRSYGHVNFSFFRNSQP